MDLTQQKYALLNVQLLPIYLETQSAKHVCLVVNRPLLNTSQTTFPEHVSLSVHLFQPYLPKIIRRHV